MTPPTLSHIQIKPAHPIWCKWGFSIRRLPPDIYKKGTKMILATLLFCITFFFKSSFLSVLLFSFTQSSHTCVASGIHHLSSPHPYIKRLSLLKSKLTKRCGSLYGSFLNKPIFVMWMESLWASRLLLVSRIRLLVDTKTLFNSHNDCMKHFHHSLPLPTTTHVAIKVGQAFPNWAAIAVASVSTCCTIKPSDNYNDVPILKSFCISYFACQHPLLNHYRCLNFLDSSRMTAVAARCSFVP